MAPEVSPGSRNRESSWLPNRKMMTVMTREDHNHEQAGLQAHPSPGRTCQRRVLGGIAGHGVGRSSCWAAWPGCRSWWRRCERRPTPCRRLTSPASSSWTGRPGTAGAWRASPSGRCASPPSCGTRGIFMLALRLQGNFFIRWNITTAQGGHWHTFPGRSGWPRPPRHPC